MSRFALPGFVTLVFVFLMLPLVVVVATSFGPSHLMRFPPESFSLASYGRIPSEFYEAAITSLIIASGSTLISVLVGTPAALALVRQRFVGRGVVNAIFLSPLVVPTLVIAVAGFQFLIVVWRLTGIDLQDTYLGLILGHSSFTMAFVVRSTIAAQANYDRAVEEASTNLGARPIETFFRITLPLIAPGIASGAIFAFLMSFDELPIALFMGGPHVTTLPVKIFITIEDSLDTWIMALAAMIVFISLGVILALRGLLTGIGSLQKS
jgi:putative spermidine/putrescine transport system permease protein